MIEIPEATNYAKQLNETIKGKTISKVIAGQTTHKFTWFYGDLENYEIMLKNKTINETNSFGGYVEISVENTKILFHEGINLRFLKDSSDIPDKHQLLIEFTDGTFLCTFIRMYGGVGCFVENTLDNKYYLAAKKKPSPLSKSFDEKYFEELVSKEDIQKLSVKAFLATDQRIPGLGNGVLQDILYNAKIHPKQKLEYLSEEQKQDLFNSLKNTLKEMVEKNGRDTEKDLYSNLGRYKTKVSKNTVGKKCSLCNSIIEKGSYMGRSIYFCSGCQKI
jgi:formamidopyrimidine-DNA glycosylase